MDNFFIHSSNKLSMLILDYSTEIGKIFDFNEFLPSHPPPGVRTIIQAGEGIEDQSFCLVKQALINFRLHNNANDKLE